MASPDKFHERVNVNHARYEYLVLFSLLCVLLLVEIGLRSQESRLSGNVAHVKDIPAIASNIAPAPSVLFIGNSLTNNAIDPSQFHSLTNHAAGIKTVRKIVPDGTSLSDWYCIIRNQIIVQDRTPNITVIGFAWAQLSDQYPINPARLGGLFCSATDVMDLSATGLTNHNHLLSFFSGSLSHVYLHREAIRNRTLDSLIYGYRNITQDINERTESGDREPSSAHNFTYHTLQQLDTEIRLTGSRLVVMAMPVVHEYSLDPGLQKELDRLNITFLDMRRLNDLDRSMYLDPIHLNDTGRKVFTEALAHTMTPILSATQ